MKVGVQIEDFAKLADEISSVEESIDTGSCIFNGLCSGSIFGGFSSNSINAIAGESGTGKIYFSLAVVRNFLDNNPFASVLYFDTESSINRRLV
jgi:KaiC/GvpD/RAD55 family RecA-like ATPase